MSQELTIPGSCQYTQVFCLFPMLKGCKHLTIALPRLIKLKSMSLRDLYCFIQSQR